MTKIKITARDSSTAMEEVSKKLGADAFILSTTSKAGGVEIEATNDPVELKKFSERPKKKFSNLMKKQLGNITEFPLPAQQKQMERSSHSYEKLNVNRGDPDLSILTQNIKNLSEEIRGMYITGGSGLSVEIGQSTFVRLEQAGFNPSVLKTLSPSFTGLNFERGRAAFMSSLSNSLTVPEVDNKLKRITFINGMTGVGKTTLTAKISVSEQDNNREQITLAKLGYSNDLSDESLRAHGRLLNQPVLRLNPDNLMEILCSTKGKILVDVCLDKADAVTSILKAVDFLSDREITSIVAIPGGASSGFIRGQATSYKSLKPELALTKLDECDLTSSEMSEFFLNSMKIHYLTGSKYILGGLSVCNQKMLNQYLIENC